MRTLLRTLIVPLALAGVVVAHADLSLYFADATTGLPLSTLALTATSTTVSVFATTTNSTTATTVNDAEVFAAYDVSDTGGSSATPGTAKNKLVSLTNPTAPSGLTFNTVSGGITYRAVGTTGVGTRAFGLDILDLSGTSGSFSVPTTGRKLFDVTLNNIGLTTGQSSTLSFVMGNGMGSYATNFFGGASGGSITTSPAAVGGTLTVIAAPVPEPTTVAALGLGALAMLRRRKRA